MFDDLDLTKAYRRHTREHVARLLNLIETLGADLRAAQAEIPPACEVNRLKGEQGSRVSNQLDQTHRHGSCLRATAASAQILEERQQIQQVQIDREQVLPG